MEILSATAGYVEERRRGGSRAGSEAFGPSSSTTSMRNRWSDVAAFVALKRPCRRRGAVRATSRAGQMRRPRLDSLALTNSARTLSASPRRPSGLRTGFRRIWGLGRTWSQIVSPLWHSQLMLTPDRSDRGHQLPPTISRYAKKRQILPSDLAPHHPFRDNCRSRSGCPRGGVSFTQVSIVASEL